jgi:hypothetical protein
LLTQDKALCNVEDCSEFSDEQSTQSRFVTGLPTGHNTLRKHFHLMSITNIFLCRRCEADDEITSHTLCGCQVLASLRHTYLCLDPEDINTLNAELNPICHLLALLVVYHFLHVSRKRVKLFTLRLLMSNIYAAPFLDVSRSHTTTHHSR